jgi:hypothetical protein
MWAFFIAPFNAHTFLYSAALILVRVGTSCRRPTGRAVVMRREQPPHKAHIHTHTHMMWRLEMRK